MSGKRGQAARESPFVLRNSKHEPPSGFGELANHPRLAALFGGRPPQWVALAGDGSERRFYRLRGNRKKTAVAVICAPGGQAEQASHLYLATHLEAKGVPVPRIIEALPELGCLVMEDAGSVHLETLARTLPARELLALYRRVLRGLAHMQRTCAEGLEERLLWQGARFDREVMLERESRYFLEQFIQGHCGIPATWEEFEAEFHLLAGCASGQPSSFFLHRDFQSRNVMVRGGKKLFFLDFQAGRLGPPAYDAASLLIDPYAGLPEELQERLLAYYATLTPEPGKNFRRGYVALALQRNLQTLGAFAFLGGVKGKRGFLRHIPRALATLRRLLADPDAPKNLPKLTGLAERASRRLSPA